MANHFIKKIVVLLLLLLLAESAFAKLFYRYKGEHDTPVLDDNVPPPEFIKKGYSIVNQQGVVIEVVAPQKTEAQQQADAVASKVKQKQDAAKHERDMHDSVLMGTFLNIHDIYAVRDRKLAALDTLIEISRSNRQQLQTQLISLRNKTQIITQAGKPIPFQQQAVIDNTVRQIAENDAAIRSKYTEQQMIRLQAAVDAVRFQYLNQARLKEEPPDPQPQLALDNTMGIGDCTGAASCRQAWQLTKDYVRQHATLPILLENEEVMLTEPAIKPIDVSLAATQVYMDEDKAKVLLLITCGHGIEGARLCKTPKILAIQNNLSHYIEDQQKKSSVPVGKP